LHKTQEQARLACACGLADGDVRAGCRLSLERRFARLRGSGSLSSDDAALLQLFSTGAPDTSATTQHSDSCGSAQSDLAVQQQQQQQQQLYTDMDVHTDAQTVDNGSSDVMQTVHSSVKHGKAQHRAVTAYGSSSNDSGSNSSDSDSDFEKPSAVAARKRQASAAAGQHQLASKRTRTNSSSTKHRSNTASSGTAATDDDCTVSSRNSSNSSSNSSGNASSSSGAAAAASTGTDSKSSSVSGLPQRGTALPFGNLDALALGPLACDAHVAGIVAAACKHGGRHEPKSPAAAASSTNSSTLATSKKSSPAKGKSKSTRVQLVGNRLNCVVGVKSRFVGYGSGHTCSVEKLVLQVMLREFVQYTMSYCVHPRKIVNTAIMSAHTACART
jgi:hypothetical protein